MSSFFVDYLPETLAVIVTLTLILVMIVIIRVGRVRRPVRLPTIRDLVIGRLYRVDLCSEAGIVEQWYTEISKSSGPKQHSLVGHTLYLYDTVTQEHGLYYSAQKTAGKYLVVTDNGSGLQLHHLQTRTSEDVHKDDVLGRVDGQQKTA